MMNDNENVTYKAFFKMCMLILTGTIAYVATLIPTIYGRNCIIVSLFLMLGLAFVYVILLYIAFDRMTKTGQMQEKNRKNVIINSINGTRIAIKVGIITFILAEASKELVLRRYDPVWVAIPILLTSAYIAGRGMGGVIRFAEAVFWFAVAAGGMIFVLSLRNVDLAQIHAYTRWTEEGGLGATINNVMVRGGLLLLGYGFIEIVIMIYMRVKNRRRGMLIAAVGVPSIIGLIGSIIVVITLGVNSLSTGRKNILYMVGAMELPGGLRIRPLILVSYLVVVWGVTAAASYGACVFGMISADGGKMPRLRKLIWMAAALVVCICLQRGIMGRGEDWGYGRLAYNLIPRYILLVDMPLSIILPVLSVCWRGSANGRWRKGVKICGVMLGCTFCAGVCTGCVYESVENVDYANVLAVDFCSHGTGKLDYTLVIPDIGEEAGKGAKEQKYTFCADSFEDVRRQYNSSHANRLDTSHVEYVAASEARVMNSICAELQKEFETSYVTVVVDKNILQKSGTNNTKEYLRTHYKGRCLAVLNE